MMTLIEFEDGSGEVLSVEEDSFGVLGIGVTVGPNYHGSTIGEGDTFFVTLTEDEVEDLIVALDQWRLERRVALEQHEDHCEHCPCPYR